MACCSSLGSSIFLANKPKDRIAQLIGRFGEKTGPHVGVEDRVGGQVRPHLRGGQMALEAGLLDWPSGRPLQAATALYRRSKELRLGMETNVDQAMAKLAKALDDELLFGLQLRAFS